MRYSLHTYEICDDCPASLGAFLTALEQGGGRLVSLFPMPGGETPAGWRYVGILDHGDSGLLDRALADFVRGTAAAAAADNLPPPAEVILRNQCDTGADLAPIADAPPGFEWRETAGMQRRRYELMDVRGENFSLFGVIMKLGSPGEWSSYCVADDHTARHGSIADACRYLEGRAAAAADAP